VRDPRASSDDLDAVLHRAAGRIMAGNKAAGALLFSCLGRGRSFYGRPDHDSEKVKAILGELPIGGFFCAGEIGPVGAATFLHGYTSSFAVFRPE
jgi:small ligand-binding sensory domain FIST